MKLAAKIDRNGCLLGGMYVCIHEFKQPIH
jgi:hypothetical protein